MTLRQVLVNAFTFLRQHPKVFIPRLAMAVVWSVFWVAVVQMFQDPYSITLQHIFTLSVFTMLMAPLQIWVYNSYFVMVKQHRDDGPHLKEAFREGFKKLPQSIAVFALLGTMSLIFGMPGAILFLYGVMSDLVLLQLAGLGLSGAGIAGVLIISYFAPVSVVIGEQSFFENVKAGIIASHEERHEVVLLTGLSFATLLLASLLRGGWEYLGIIGFFGGRIVAAVIGVYILVVNPELFLHSMRSDSEETEE